MFLIVKDVEKAKELLKTNRPLKEGQEIKAGDAVMMSKLAMKNPDVFGVGGVEKAPKKPRKERGSSKQRKLFGPKNDKMGDSEDKKTK